MNSEPIGSGMPIPDEYPLLMTGRERMLNAVVPRVRLGRATVALLVIFLVAFPKAGIKVSSVPITFGYLLLGAAAVFAGLLNIGRGEYRVFSRRSFLAFWATLPLQAVVLLLASSLDSAVGSYTLSFIVGFLLLPMALLLVLVPQVDRIDARHLERWLRRCVTFAAIYGIFLFFYVIATGHFVDIPYLTVNAGDVADFAHGAVGKRIDRGHGIFKLISTYNNGNIYGVSILMLLPLYDLVQRSRWMKLLVKLSLLLTLSRTVWLGLIAYELIAAVYIRRLKLFTLHYIVGFVAVAVAAVIYMVAFMQHGMGFIFDPNLGGRAAALEELRLYFVPDGTILFPSEILYVNVLWGLGWAGLVCVLIAMIGPVVLAALGPRQGEPHVRALVVGMGMLLICGLSDGPIIYIPVMAFYWALASLAVSRVSWRPSSYEVARPPALEGPVPSL